jgi:hypothetical protein
MVASLTEKITLSRDRAPIQAQARRGRTKPTMANEQKEKP